MNSNFWNRFKNHATGWNVESGRNTGGESLIEQQCRRTGNNVYKEKPAGWAGRMHLLTSQSILGFLRFGSKTGLDVGL